ncbi:MAG: hypothetical protein M1830_001995 [Pleopsidium flavum]|nr:MAG: hypothetical protein M1830_001995 [Pleopsidium flavum]
MSLTSNGGETASPPTSGQLYRELTRFFGEHAGKVLEIEILPSGFPLPPGTTSPLLQDGTNLGITKQALVQAFLVARHTCFNNLKLNRLIEQQVEAAEAATQIILLFDPEHLTAANLRKKRLLRLEAPDYSGLSEVLTKAIKNELAFLETLLTSPLHRHTKSPTLWYHRHWLVQKYLNQLCQTQSILLGEHGNSEDDRKLLWMSEFEVIMRASDRHPKNYYAWAYARRLLDFLSQRDLTAASANPLPSLPACSAQRMLDWCLGHPTDISGWSFLLHLLQKLPDGTAVQVSIIQKALEFTYRLSWDGEALWWFLRTVLAMEDIMPASLRRKRVHDISEHLEALVQYQAFNAENSFTVNQKRTDMVMKAVRFCERYGRFDDAPVEA